MTAPLCLVTAVVCLAAALAPAAAYSVDTTTTATVVRTANNGIKFENGIPILDPAPATSTEDEAAAVVLFNEDLEAAKLMEMLTEAATDNLTAASEPRFPSGEVTIESYHSYDQLQRLAAELVTAFPNLVTKYSIGSSVQDREILALKIRLAHSICNLHTWLFYLWMNEKQIDSQLYHVYSLVAPCLSP